MTCMKDHPFGEIAGDKPLRDVQDAHHKGDHDEIERLQHRNVELIQESAALEQQLEAARETLELIADGVYDTDHQQHCFEFRKLARLTLAAMKWRPDDGHTGR